MGAPTPNLLLKQWAATDEKIQTWTDYNSNLLILDEKLTNAQTVLWTGPAYMVAGAPIVPTKKLSECRNGWTLIWSDYDPGVGANDYDIFETKISKKRAELFPGKAGLFTIPTSLSSGASSFVNKRLYIYDNQIVGHDDNGLGANGSDPAYGANDVCLRYIIED